MLVLASAHPRDDLLYLLLVTLHLEVVADLDEVHGLPVSLADDLIERFEDLKRVLGNLALLGRPAHV